MSHDCWHDQDARGGQRWWDEICSNIRQSDLMVFLLSPHSVRSVACLAELEYAAALGIRVLPVAFDEFDVNLLPKALLELQIFRVNLPSDKAAYLALENEIGELLSSIDAADRKQEVPVPPLPLTPEQRVRFHLEAPDLSEAQQRELLAEIEAIVRRSADPNYADQLLEQWLESPQWFTDYRIQLRELRSSLPVHQQPKAVPARPKTAALPGAIAAVVALLLAFQLEVGISNHLFLQFALITLYPLMLSLVVINGWSSRYALFIGFFLTMEYVPSDTLKIGLTIPMFVAALVFRKRFLGAIEGRPLVAENVAPLAVTVPLLILAAFSVSWLASDVLSFEWSSGNAMQLLAGVLVLFGWASARTVMIGVSALFVPWLFWPEIELIPGDILSLSWTSVSWGEWLTTLAIIAMCSLSRSVLNGSEQKTAVPFVLIVAFSALALPNLSWVSDLSQLLSPSLLRDALAQSANAGLLEVEEVVVSGMRRRDSVGSAVALLFLTIFVGLRGRSSPFIGAVVATVPVVAADFLYRFVQAQINDRNPYFDLPLGLALSLIAGAMVVSRVWTDRRGLAAGP